MLYVNTHAPPLFVSSQRVIIEIVSNLIIGLATLPVLPPKGPPTYKVGSNRGVYAEK